MAEGDFTVGEPAGPRHDPQHPLGVGHMGEQDVDHAPPAVRRHRQTVLDQQPQPRQLVVVGAFQPDGQARQGAAGQRRQVETAGQFDRSGWRLVVGGALKLRPDVARPVAQHGGRLGAQPIGGQGPFAVHGHGAVKQREEILLALHRLAPDPVQDPRRKDQGRHAVGAPLKQRQQWGEGRAATGAIARLCGDDVRQFGRLVALQRRHGRAQHPQRCVGAGLDDRRQGGVVGGGQGRHESSCQNSTQAGTVRQSG